MSHCTFLQRKRRSGQNTFVQIRTTIPTGARLTGSLIELALGASEASWTHAEIATREGVIVDAGAIVLAGLEGVTSRSGCVAVGAESRRIRTDSWDEDARWHGCDFGRGCIC